MTRPSPAISVGLVPTARDELEARTTHARGLALVALGGEPEGDPERESGVLCPAFVEALTAHLDALARGPGVALLSLGERAGATLPRGLFVSHDELLALGSVGAGEALARAGRRALAALERLPVVLVQRGPARGGLFELGQACRRLLLERGAALGLSLAGLGLIEAQGGLVRAAERAGLGAALELVEGTSLGAERALELGLADAVVPEHTLLEAALTLGRTLDRAGGAPRGARAGALWPGEGRLARALSLWRARRALGPVARHEPARARALDVLGALTIRGPAAAHHEAARAFGELAMSSPARELVRLASRRHALRSRGSHGSHGSYDAHRSSAPETLAPDELARRVLGAARDEARRLVDEGQSPRAVEHALVDWGFPHGLLLARASAEGPMGARGARAEARPELALELRVVLAWLLEAARAVDEGVVASEAEADVRSVELGFPAFRGGPFRYLETVGAPEVSARLAWLRARHGERFEAPLRLRARAPEPYR